MGGPDAEREVSQMSGREVASAIRESSRFTVNEQVIDKPSLNELKSLAEGCDAVFPVLHGRWGEGGPLQELLEQLGLPYVGCRAKAASLAMDKMATKTLAATDNVPTPPSRALQAGDVCDLEPPLVLKPIDDGSSVDLRICQTPAQVDEARKQLHPKRGRLLAERYIKGREVTVGIVGGKALPLIEIIPSKQVEFYDYQAKYFRDDTRYVLEPDMPPGLTERCQAIALSVFNRLGCRDIARADLMIDERGPWFLEINTMPGFTTHSLVPMAARRNGVEMPELCARLVETALERGSSRTSTGSGVKPHAAARR
jgi:D-alanine-D-alanine ligase